MRARAAAGGGARGAGAGPRRGGHACSRPGAWCTRCHACFWCECAVRGQAGRACAGRACLRAAGRGREGARVSGASGACGDAADPVWGVCFWGESGE